MDASSKDNDLEVFHHKKIDQNYDLYVNLENIADTTMELGKKTFDFDKHPAKAWKKHSFRLWCSKWLTKDDDPEETLVVVDHFFKRKLIESICFTVNINEYDIDKRYAAEIESKSKNSKLMKTMIKITPECWLFESDMMDWNWLICQIEKVSKKIDELLREF